MRDLFLLPLPYNGEVKKLTNPRYTFCCICPIAFVFSPMSWRPGDKIFRKGAKLIADKVCKKRRRFAPPLFRYPRKTARGCLNTPPPAGRGLNGRIDQDKTWSQGASAGDLFFVIYSYNKKKHKISGFFHSPIMLSIRVCHPRPFFFEEHGATSILSCPSYLGIKWLKSFSI